MSILSLAEVAVARDEAEWGSTTRSTRRPAVTGRSVADQPVTSTPTAAAPGTSTPPAAAADPQEPAPIEDTEDTGKTEDTQKQTTSNALTSAIPTETLAVYTGVVGLFLASQDEALVNGYLPFRWWAFGAFVAVTFFAVWLAYRMRQPDDERKRNFPLLEAVTSALAAAVWGLVMPGSPLIVQLEGPLRTIVVGTLTLVGPAVVTTLSAYLTRGARETRGTGAEKTRTGRRRGVRRSRAAAG